jgi:hypothetical protein
MLGASGSSSRIPGRDGQAKGADRPRQQGAGRLIECCPAPQPDQAQVEHQQATERDDKRDDVKGLGGRI